jgi:hypothetical protein
MPTKPNPLFAILVCAALSLTQFQSRLEIHPRGRRQRGTGPFDDSKWTDVSAPHTYNDVDSYTEIISHSGGDRGAWTGITWYRKHFKLPAGAKDGKVFLEFEGLKQAGRFWVNGKYVGKYENGVTPCGLDLTGFVNFGDADNVIAVKVDNSNDYKEEATGTATNGWAARSIPITAG